MISKYAKDKMIIEFLKPKEFSALQDRRVHLAAERKVFELPMQMKPKEVETTNTIFKATKILLTIFFSATSVSSLFMSILFVYLMGLVNGLQI